jgi:flagellar hook-associated protein 3 FlgL
MRITTAMMADNSLRNVQANLSRVDQLQNQITSGSRITRPSDDPIGAAQALGLQESLDQSQQYGRNIDQATSWLNSADATLGSVTDALQRARELAVQATSTTLTQSDRGAIQAEVTQLQQHVLTLTQSKYGAYYMFSGTRSDQPGFVSPHASTSVTNPNSYQGNQSPVQREISPGVSLTVSVDPTTTFNDLFDALDGLQTGLASGDTATMSNTLNQFDTALDSISTARSSIGARVNRLEGLQQRQAAVSVNLTGLLSNIKDVDMPAAITNFSMAQTIYQASRKASAQMLQSSLLDYLR